MRRRRLVGQCCGGLRLLLLLLLLLRVQAGARGAEQRQQAAAQLRRQQLALDQRPAALAKQLQVLGRLHRRRGADGFVAREMRRDRRADVGPRQAIVRERLRERRAQLEVQRETHDAPAADQRDQQPRNVGEAAQRVDKPLGAPRCALLENLVRAWVGPDERRQV